MPERDAISAYLETVGEQIRWGRARRAVLPELREHLEDQRDDFAAQGLEDPAGAAVEEMGDPISVGAELDRIHRPRPQWGLLGLTVALAVAGGALRVWLTAGWADLYQDVDPVRTALAVALGCGALLAGYFLDISFLGRHARAIYLLSVAATLAMWGISPRVWGVPFYARYTEFFFPVVYACWLYRCRRGGWRGLVKAAAGLVPLTALCLMAPYGFALVQMLGTALVLAVLACRWDWFGVGTGKSLLAVLGLTAGAAGAAAWGIARSGYGLRRLTAAVDPGTDPLGAGYMGLNIRRALEGARWWGQGSWTGPRPYEQTVPSCDADALLTTLIHRLGWVPFLLAVAAVCALVGWLVCRCLRQQGRLGRLVVTAVVTMLALQMAFSLAWNLGVTLEGAFFPLLIGNAWTVFDMGLIGLALSAFRGDSVARDEDCAAPWRPRFRVHIRIERL